MPMDSSSAQSHRQEIGSETLESMLMPTKAQAEKKPKPAEQALNCPRCDSTNTKFCYYNNYSLSQPRYFCKSCRRYWTKGGTLRNVPVGGGCRKTKRSSSSSSKRSHEPISRNPSPSMIPSYSPLSYDSNAFASGLDDSVFRSHPSGFLESQLGFQNLYYGIGDGAPNLGLEINGGMGMGMGIGIGIGLSQEMGLLGFEEASGATTASTAVTTVKQEMCSGVGGEISRGLWGFPWQNGGGEGNLGEMDVSRIGNWNGNWQGLLNTPLM